MKDVILQYAKAIVAALVAGLTYFVTVLAPEATFADITMMQWIGFAIAVLTSGAAVAVVPNKKKEEPVQALYEDNRIG